MWKCIVKIPLQSISDIITNSSSETFCYITSDNRLDAIYDMIEDLGISTDYDSDHISASIEEEGNRFIQIDVPYCLYEYYDIISAGIRAILDLKMNIN